jgi:hypothetical protein
MCHSVQFVHVWPVYNQLNPIGPNDIDLIAVVYTTQAEMCHGLHLAQISTSGIDDTALRAATGSA